MREISLGKTLEPAGNTTAYETKAIVASFYVLMHPAGFFCKS